MKKTFLMLLSACLMTFCFSFAFADNLNEGKSNEYIETDNCNEIVDWDGEKMVFCDVPFAAATLNLNEESDNPSPACQFVETGDGDDDYSECELVMTAIDDVTYEVAMPDGRVFGTFYKSDDENFAVPYTSYEVNWLVNAGRSAHATRYVESASGLTFTFALNATPAGNSRIGFYCYNDSTYAWLPEAWKTSTSGNFVLNGSYGLVAFAIGNQSSTAIRYSGSYAV